MPAMNIYTSTKKPIGFYVYAYLRKDGTPYYIGKGKGERAWTRHHNVSTPEQTEIVILEAKLTEIGALALERRMICWYGRKDNATGILRNRTDGGEGASGGICSAETRLKLSEASKGCKGRKGHKHSAETRKKLSEALKGRIFSEETRNKLSEALKGRIFSEESKLKMSESSKGHKHSAETRKKLSEASKGRKHSAESKLKMSEANKGRKGHKHSEEHKLKLSEAGSKIWFFIDPTGINLSIKNLAKFCQENNLGQTSMGLVAKGEKESYKGWIKF
jgi:hypothetical protein